MLTLIDNSQDLNDNMDQLLASMTSLKFEYIDLGKMNTGLKEENEFLQKKVQQLDSCTLSLKIEFLKLSVIDKEKGNISDDQIKCEHDFKTYKNELFSKK